MWNDAENAAIDALQRDGFNSVDARVITALISRRYVRELPKLIDILSGHVGLEDHHNVRMAVDSLLHQDIITGATVQGRTLLGITPDFADNLVTQGQSSSAAALKSLQWAPNTRLEMLGPMTDPAVLETFKNALSSASYMIRIPFFTSSADIEAIDILENRARAGVHVRILLGSPSVIAEIRGPSARSRAERAVDSWKTRTRNWPNTEIRLASRVIDIQFGSSLSIDGSSLRLDLHEPLAERSLMGDMVKVNSSAGNLVRVFDAAFDEAWRRALPISKLGRIFRFLKSVRWTLTTAVSLPAALLISGNSKELVGGIAVASLFAALDENKERIALAWRRVTGKK
ncbi:MAG: hypothetical protein ACRDTG_27055 [Pseudonocardiaceae bacterium]